MTYYSIEWSGRERELFESDRPAETNEQIMALAKEFNERVGTEKYLIIGIWEDEDRTQIKRFVVNRTAKMTAIQHEYSAALAWNNLASERHDYLLAQMPEYDIDNFEVAVACEEAADKKSGFDRSLDYLKEVEDRLLEENHAYMKKLPRYTKDIELLFEKAQTNIMVRRKVVDLAAKTKY